MIFSENTIQKVTEKYSNATTRKQFFSRLNKISKLLQTESIDEIDVLENIDLIISKLEDTNKASKGLYLNTVKQYLLFFGLENDTLNNELVIAYNQRHQIDNNRHKTDILNTSFTMKDVYEFYEEDLQNNWSIKNQNRVMMFYLLKLSPLRINELIISLETDNVKNYIDFDNKILFIQSHKTFDRTKHVREIQLSDQDIEFIKDHQQKVNQHNLLVNKSGHVLNANNLEQLFRESIQNFCKQNNIEYKKGISGIHNVRSLAENENLKPLLEAGINYEKFMEISNKCKQMGHGISVALKHYSKVNNITPN